MVFEVGCRDAQKNPPNLQLFSRNLVNVNLVSVALKPETSEGWLVAFL